MASIETLRFLPDPADDRRHQAWRREPELLDLLASGHPPAFAVDSRERIVFWNGGAEALFGLTAREVMGQRGQRVIGGRDVWGPGDDSTSPRLDSRPLGGGFEIDVCRAGGGAQRLLVTTLRVPGPRDDLFMLVHLLQPIDESARMARLLSMLACLPREGGPPDALAGSERAGSGARDGLAPEPDVDAPALTAREREVLQWMAAGLKNKQIAERLHLSLSTVRNHIHNTLDRLGVHSKLAAVSLAFRSGWIVPDAGPGGSPRTPPFRPSPDSRAGSTPTAPEGHIIREARPPRVEARHGTAPPRDEPGPGRGRSAAHRAPAGPAAARAGRAPDRLSRPRRAAGPGG